MLLKQDSDLKNQLRNEIFGVKALGGVSMLKLCAKTKPMLKQQHQPPLSTQKTQWNTQANTSTAAGGQYTVLHNSFDNVSLQEDMEIVPFQKQKLQQFYRSKVQSANGTQRSVLAAAKIQKNENLLHNHVQTGGRPITQAVAQRRRRDRRSNSLEFVNQGGDIQGPQQQQSSTDTIEMSFDTQIPVIHNTVPGAGEKLLDIWAMNESMRTTPANKEDRQNQQQMSLNGNRGVVANRSRPLGSASTTIRSQLSNSMMQQSQKLAVKANNTKKRNSVSSAARKNIRTFNTLKQSATTTGRHVRNLSLINAPQNSFFGSQDQIRISSGSFQQTFGVKSMTNHDGLKKSIQAYKSQVNDAKRLNQDLDQDTSKNEETKSLCNFEKFNHKQTVNTFFGIAACNPDGDKLKAQKPNNISAKINLLGPLHVNYTTQGRPKSIDMSMYAKLPQSVEQFSRAIPVQKETLKKKKEKLQQVSTEQRHQNNQKQDQEPQKERLDKKINIQISKESDSDRIINISSIVPRYEAKIKTEQEVKTSQKLAQRSKALPQKIHSSPARPQKFAVPSELLQMQKEALSKDNIESSYKLLKREQAYEESKAGINSQQVRITISQPHNRVRMENQWAISEQNLGQSKTKIALNPTVSLVKKAIPQQEKNFLAQKQMRLELAKMQRIKQAKTKVELESQRLMQLHIRGLTNKLTQQLYEQRFGKEISNGKRSRQLPKGFLQEIKEKANAAVKEHLINIKKVIQETNIEKTIKTIAKASKEDQKKTQQENYDREDAFDETFVSEEIASSDSDLIDTTRKFMERDANLEKKLLMRMNQDASPNKSNNSFDRKSADDDDDYCVQSLQSSLQNKKKKLGSYSNSLSNNKTRLTKHDLSTPALRMSRFTAEIFNDNKIYQQPSQTSQVSDSEPQSQSRSDSMKSDDSLALSNYSLKSITSGASSMDSKEFEAQQRKQEKFESNPDVRGGRATMKQPSANVSSQKLVRIKAKVKAQEATTPVLKRGSGLTLRRQSMIKGMDAADKKKKFSKLLTNDINIQQGTPFEQEQYQNDQSALVKEKLATGENNVRKNVLEVLGGILTVNQIKKLESKVFQPNIADEILESQNSVVLQERNFDASSIGSGTKLTAGIEKNMANEAMDVMKNLKFNEVFKNQFETQGYEQVYKDDPMFIYQQQITEHKDVLLPLINKIKNKTLVLKDYTLNSGHCLALAEVWNKLGKPQVDVVYLDNCGIDDEEFSSLLGGFVHLETLRLLFYKENMFSHNSLRAIKPLLLKRYPNNLRELKLVKVNTSSHLINDLIQFMIDEPTSLTSLSLVQMDLPSTIMPTIVEYLENSVQLEELDLSWNKFQPHDFLPLLNNLSNNVILRVLNLSWNLLIPSILQKEQSDYIYPSRLSKQLLREDWEMNHSQIIANRFSKMIRFNNALQHIDLANTGLSEVFLFDMLPALRRAKGLLSFHVGSNPGINKKITTYWKNKLRCVDKDVSITIQVQKEKNNFKALLDNKKLSKKLSKIQFQALEFKSKQIESQLISETFSTTANNNKSTYLQLSEVTIKTNSSDMSISRQIGHKIDIPGSGQWRMQKKSDLNNCWCCNHSIYSLMFWSKQIGYYHEEFHSQIEPAEKLRVEKLIKGYHTQEAEDGLQKSGRVPVLFSNCTNWTGKPFRKVFDFIEELSGIQPDFDEEVDKLLKQQRQFKFPSDYQLKEKDKQKMMRWRNNKKNDLLEDHKRNLYDNHKEILRKKLVYKNPNLINYDLMDDPDNTYVLPIFIRPGRNHFFVRDIYNVNFNSDLYHRRRENFKQGNFDQSHFRFFYSRQITKIREEIIPKLSKQMKRTFIKTKFDKEHSVFKDWKEDNKYTVDKCLKHDFYYWKCKKFIKDKNELSMIQNIFRENFSDLKEIFLQIVAKGAEPPDIGPTAFLEYCQMAGIIDEAVTPSVLDIYFASTNFEEEDQDGNNDRALIRFEFLEILVRIVRGKYIERKRLTSISEGLKKLLNEHVLPSKDKYFTWQSFRDNHLWEFHVNEILEANIYLLENLYQKLQKTKTKKSTRAAFSRSKLLQFDNLIEHIYEQSQALEVSRTQLNMAFMLCKMTCEAENEQGPLDYNQIKFVEFLEFIGRIAYFKFQDTEQHKKMTLAAKIYTVLKSIFVFIGEEPINPEDMNNLESDSDDDY